MDEQARIVRNADIPKLQAVYGIMQEIVKLEERREWQRERMTNITQHITGMPGGGGMPRGLDDAFALISQIETEHKGAVKKYAAKLKQAEAIINGIENDNMRAFVIMMYLDNEKDADVRMKLNMTRRGFERARSAIEEAKSMDQVIWHERYMMGE